MQTWFTKPLAASRGDQYGILGLETPKLAIMDSQNL